MILGASSQPRFSHIQKESVKTSSFQNTRHPFRHPSKNVENVLAKQRTTRIANYFAWLQLKKNHMFACHKETLYHSLNIGPALIVNWIISIQHQAEMKYCENKHSCEVCPDLLQSSAQENPEDCPLHMYVPLSYKLTPLTSTKILFLGHTLPPAAYS